MGSSSCCCMGCKGDDDGGGDGVLYPKGFFLALLIALVLFMLCHRPQPRRNNFVVYRCY